MPLINGCPTIARLAPCPAPTAIVQPGFRPARSSHNARYKTKALENDSASLSVLSPKARVLELLGKGYSTYNPGPELEQAVEELTLSNPTTSPGIAASRIGEGVWEVFYAPHIANSSKLVLTQYDPIRYVFQNDRFASHVKFSHPIFGQGWLSAAGTLKPKDDDSVIITFNQFWVDFGADKLRPYLSEDVDGPKINVLGQEVRVDSLFDEIAGAFGRFAFFPQLAVFPVLYLDLELAVFKFPPLDSKIAVKRTSQTVIPTSSYWE